MEVIMRFTLTMCAFLMVSMVFPLVGCVSEGRAYDDGSNKGKSEIRMERERLLSDLKEKKTRIGYTDDQKRMFQYEADILRNFLEGEDLFAEKRYFEAKDKFEDAMVMIKTVPGVTKRVRELYSESKAFNKKIDKITKPR